MMEIIVGALIGLTINNVLAIIGQIAEDIAEENKIKRNRTIESL